MKEYIRGYIFIPVRRSQSAEQIIRMSVERMGGVHQISSLYIWREESEDWIDVPLAELCRAGRGGLQMHIGRLDCSWQFSPRVGRYHVIRISIYDPFCQSHACDAEIEAFLTQWRHFCDEVRAEFAYLKRDEQVMQRVYHIEELLLALQHGDMAEMFTQIWPYWLLYLGAEHGTCETERLLTRFHSLRQRCGETLLTRTTAGAIFARSEQIVRMVASSS